MGSAFHPEVSKQTKSSDSPKWNKLSLAEDSEVHMIKLGKKIMAICLVLGLGATILSCSPRPVAEKKASEPVVFWAHYMPQIPNGHLHAHPHTGGNHDAWPLNEQAKSDVEEYKQHMRQALASGINGFQMLAFTNEAMFQAAREIYKETGQMFYIAPEWSGLPKEQGGMLDGRDDALKTIIRFANQHRDNPHVFRKNGKQLHFFYGSPGKWSDTAEGIELFRKDLAEAGVEVMLIPTLYWFDRRALGYHELMQKPWPVGETPAAKDSKWLKNLGWEGATSFDYGISSKVGEPLDKQLREVRPDFLWIPSVTAGYDSSNRPVQAIHSSFLGLHNLYDALKFWIGKGYSQITYITWNDCLESMLIPSSRNIWGYNTIVRYFRGIAEKGQSPFEEPEVVISYPVECLYGDKFFFQALAFPAAGSSLMVKAKLELVPLGGGKPVLLSAEGQSTAEQPEVFMEKTWQTGGEATPDAFQPFITVEVRSHSFQPWKKLCDRMPLAVSRMRFNLVEFPVPYAINIRQIESQTTLALNLDNASPLSRVTVDVSGKEPLRRLVLTEGSLSLGCFRPARDPQRTPNTLQDVYVRLEASENIPLRLGVDKGQILDFYSPNPSATTSLQKVLRNSADFSAFPPGSFRSRVARMDLEADSLVKLGIPQLGNDPVLQAGLPELQGSGVTKTVNLPSGPVRIGMTLTSDATEPNIDFPLPASGHFQRVLPLNTEQHGLRVLQAVAWLQNDKVAFSNAVLSSSQTDSETAAIQWVETNGTFDSFIQNYSAVTLNPFTPDQVKIGALSKDRIPYFQLSFEEAAGARLNDRGTSQQPGRAWIERGPGKLGHMATYASEKAITNSRIEGVRGQGLMLTEDTRVRFRSKSAMVGATTVSVWVKVSEGTEANPVLKKLFAGPFALTIGHDSMALAAFGRAGLSLKTASFSADLQPGWNHLVFSYDLQSITVSINGKPVVTQSSVPPVYQRSHQVPFVGFAEPAKTGLGFSGALDELEIIGTGLGPSDINQLFNGSPWKTSTTKKP